MLVPVLTFPCLTGHHCKVSKKAAGVTMSTAPVSTAPVDRSLMEPGIMVNRWCHLCPGGLGVWKRSVFVGVQSFCFTLKIFLLGSPKKPTEQQKQHVFQLVVPRYFFFFFRAFLDPYGSLVDLFFRHGTKKGRPTGKLGSPPLCGRFQKPRQVFWFWCHFTRWRWSVGGVRSWGKFVRDRSWGI